MLTRSFSAIINDKEVSLFVKAPSLQDQREATKVYNQNFSEALKAKAVVRAKLDDVLMEQGLWDANKQAQFTKVQNDILEGERKLAKGGISILEAKKVALNMKKSRDDLRDLIAVKTNLDTHTAEGQADNARFNYLVSACTVYTDTKEQYFKNYEDYLNRSSDPVAILAAQNLAGMLYGLENDYESKLPENRFLKQYKFVDDQLRLINKNSHLVDDDGRLVDENGRYVNDKGEFVDKDGNPVDNQGDYLLDFQPFLDENGQPIILDTENRNDNTTKETSSSSSSAN
jgi:hypothetical protein